MGQPAPKNNLGEANAEGGSSSGGSMEEILASIRKIITSDEKDMSTKPARSGTRIPSSKDNAVTGKDTSKGSLSALAEKLKAPSVEKMNGETSPAKSASSPSTTPSASMLSAPSPASRPFAETPSATPGGLAALAAQVKAQNVGGDANSSSVSASTATAKAPDAVASESAVTSPSIERDKLVDSKPDPTIAQRVTAAAEQLSAQKTALESDTEATKDSARKNVSLSDIAAMASGSSERAETFSEKKSQQADDSADVHSKTASADKPDVNTLKCATESAFKEALVAPSTKASVSASMDRLHKSVADVNAAQVEAVLRPMLKDWLDENLPALVEQIVQREISAIVSNANLAEEERKIS